MSRFLRFIFALIFALPFFEVAAHAENSKALEMFIVEPSFSTQKINDVIQGAPDHSTVVFKSGQYIVNSSIHVQSKRGLHLQAEVGVVLDAQIEPTTPKLMVEVCVGDANPCEVHEWKGEPEWIPQYAKINGFAALEILDSQEIEISGFGFRNSYPNSIAIRGNSQSIQIHHCEFVGGTNAIFATGLDVSDLDISLNSWDQDPTEKVWSSLDWQHVHHGLYNYFNGAFFQARDIGGLIRIRSNLIKNAFNGIRMKVSQAGVGNTDVIISNNQFYKISDNAVEPEVYAKNWTVTQNRMENVYAPFSLDSVEGENLVISQNVVEFSELPRTQVPANEVSDGFHQGRRLLKLKHEKDSPLSVQFLNNLIRTRCQKGEDHVPLTDVEALPRSFTVLRNHFQRDVMLNLRGDQIPDGLKKMNWFTLP